MVHHLLTFGISEIIFCDFISKWSVLQNLSDRKYNSVHFRTPGALPISSHLIQGASFFGSHTCPRCSSSSPDFFPSNLMHVFSWLYLQYVIAGFLLFFSFCCQLKSAFPWSRCYSQECILDCRSGMIYNPSIRMDVSPKGCITSWVS